MRSGDVALRVPGTGPTPRDGVEARIFDNRSAENVRVMQTVQVLEGRSAYVQTGQSVPQRERIVTRSVVGGRVVEQVVEGTDYRNLDTGFYVTPRLSGDRVTLDISTQRERARPQTGRGRRAARGCDGVGTPRRMARGRRDLRGAQQRARRRARTLRRDRSENRSVLLKVDELR